MMNRNSAWLCRGIFIGLAIMLMAASGSSALGALVNGSFEGSLGEGSYTPGWSTIGNTWIKDSSFGTGPTDGEWQALMTPWPSPENPDALPSEEAFAGTPSVSDSAIEAFLGIPSFTLDTLIAPGNATEGSAIRQTFTANAGEVLSFDWNFLTDESFYGEDAFNDFSFWTLVSAHDGMLLADVYGSTLGASATVFDTETGYFTTSFEIPTTDEYTLGFGVMDEFDDNINSGLLIDNVQLLASVPEPASFAVWTLFGVCAVLGNAYRRRRGNPI